MNILNTDVTAGGLQPAFLGNTECGCRISRPRSSVGVFSSTPKPTRLGRSGSPLDKNAATDLLLKEAGVGVTVGEAVVVTGTRTWQQEHARMMRAYRRAVSATAVTIQAEDDRYSFFVGCFHLKDWLKNDATIPAAIKTAAGVLVNTNESLKLCADLANGIKHLRADRRARVDPDSRISAVQSALQTGAFQKHVPDARARIVVVAGGSYFDAREVASACIAAWAAFLREHKLT